MDKIEVYVCVVFGETEFFADVAADDVVTGNIEIMTDFLAAKPYQIQVADVDFLFRQVGKNRLYYQICYVFHVLYKCYYIIKTHSV